MVNSRRTLESRVVGSNMREIVHVHANSFREHAYAYIMHANIKYNIAVFSFR